MVTPTGHGDTETRRTLGTKEKSPSLRASVARDREWPLKWLVLASFVLCASHPTAQKLLDRVLARVDGVPITLTDVQAAIGLGVIQVPPGPDAIGAGTQQLIDRQLELAEVQRFPPPEPGAASIAGEAARLKMNAGARLAELMSSTGLTEQRISDIGRDSLRIAAYLDQRFGTVVQVSDDEVANYYRAHEAEFTRGGDTIPFDEAEPTARQRVSNERRRATVEQWIRDLRSRADVTINK
jgi:hypothetical protein